MPNFHAQYVERWSVDAPSWDELDDERLVTELEGGLEGGPVERADRAERLIRRFLRLCEHPRTSRRLLALVQSAVEGDDAGLRLMRVVDLVNRTRLRVRESSAERAMATQVVAMVLAGVAMQRYVRPVEPLASADEDQVVTVVAPVLRAALAR